MSGSGRRRADVPRSRGPLVLALMALLGLTLTVTAHAFWPRQDDDPAARTLPPSASPTPATADDPGTDLDLSSLPIPRVLACDLLDDAALTEALGAPVTTRDAYAAGDRVELTSGVTDIAHEDGCVYRAPGAQARVWVFAAPVSTADAAGLVRDARDRPGCEVVPHEVGYGRPGLTDVCRSGRARTTTVTLRGLFGDAWFSCSLADDGSTASVRQRGTRWCVHVATVLGARP